VCEAKPPAWKKATSDWNRTSPRKLIHVDVLRADLDNCYRPYVELTGDIAQTLEALTPQLKRAKRPALSSSILETIVAERNRLIPESATRGGTPIHPLRIIHELQPFLSTNLTMSISSRWLARTAFTKHRHPRRTDVRSLSVLPVAYATGRSTQSLETTA
jgi:acetolactate synthase-1/2/3 large subunit